MLYGCLNVVLSCKAGTWLSCKDVISLPHYRDMGRSAPGMWIYWPDFFNNELSLWFHLPFVCLTDFIISFQRISDIHAFQVVNLNILDSGQYLYNASFSMGVLGHGTIGRVYRIGFQKIKNGVNIASLETWRVQNITWGSTEQNTKHVCLVLYFY
jgi:hypothetical protein